VKVLVFSLVIVVFGSLAKAEYVTIANREGREIEVELRSLENGKVEFALRSGQTHTYDMLDLSVGSRKLVKKWAEEANKVLLTPDHRIKIDVHTSRRSKDTDGGYSGWKDIDERIEPRVIITNQEYREAFKNLEATLVLVGEDVKNRRNLKILYKDKFEFSVERNSQYEWEGEPFTLDYLVDDNDSFDNSYGHRYRYFFIVVKNKEDGSVGHAAASVNQWARSPYIIDDLKIDQITDRDLR
jgi:hypothetical protein